MFLVRLALRGVDDVHQSRVFRTVSVGPAGEGGEATFKTDAVGLKFGTVAVACQAESLKGLGLSSETGPHRGDMIVFHDRGLLAYCAQPVLSLKDGPFLSGCEILSGALQEKSKDLITEIRQSLPLPYDAMSRQFFNSVKPRKDLVHLRGEFFDDAGARLAV